VAERAQLESIENSSLLAEKNRGNNKLRKSNYLSTETLISGTAVVIDYKRRHISTSGLVQNAAKRAQLELMGKLHTTIAT